MYKCTALLEELTACRKHVTGMELYRVSHAKERCDKSPQKADAIRNVTNRTVCVLCSRESIKHLFTYWPLYEKNRKKHSPSFTNTDRNWWSSSRKLERKRKESERTCVNSRTSSSGKMAGKRETSSSERLNVSSDPIILANHALGPQKRAEGRSLALGGGIQRIQAHQGQAEAAGSPDQQTRLLEVHLASSFKEMKHKD